MEQEEKAKCIMSGKTIHPTMITTKKQYGTVLTERLGMMIGRLFGMKPKLNTLKKAASLLLSPLCETLSDDGDWVYLFIAIMFSVMILDLVSRIPT